MVEEDLVWEKGLVSSQGYIGVLVCATRSYVSSVWLRLWLDFAEILFLLRARDGLIRAISWTSHWPAELGVFICVTLAFSLFLLVLNRLIWAELTSIRRVLHL